MIVASVTVSVTVVGPIPTWMIVAAVTKFVANGDAVSRVTHKYAKANLNKKDTHHSRLQGDQHHLHRP